MTIVFYYEQSLMERAIKIYFKMSADTIINVRNNFFEKDVTLDIDLLIFHLKIKKSNG